MIVSEGRTARHAGFARATESRDRVLAKLDEMERSEQLRFQQLTRQIKGHGAFLTFLVLALGVLSIAI